MSLKVNNLQLKEEKPNLKQKVAGLELKDEAAGKKKKAGLEHKEEVAGKR